MGSVPQNLLFCLRDFAWNMGLALVSGKCKNLKLTYYTDGLMLTFFSSRCLCLDSRIASYFWRWWLTTVGTEPGFRTFVNLGVFPNAKVMRMWGLSVKQSGVKWFSQTTLPFPNLNVFTVYPEKKRFFIFKFIYKLLQYRYKLKDA